MNKINLQLVTPERTLLKEEVASLVCPTADGQITILPGHVPLISTLISGELIARGDNNIEHNIHVAGGFVEVKNGAGKNASGNTSGNTSGNNSEIIILADAAEHSHEIDIARAEEAKLQAEHTLKEQNLSDEEYAFAAAMLQRNLTRLHIAKKHSHKRTRVTSEGILRD